MKICYHLHFADSMSMLCHCDYVANVAVILSKAVDWHLGNNQCSTDARWAWTTLLQQHALSKVFMCFQATVASVQYADEPARLGAG